MARHARVLLVAPVRTFVWFKDVVAVLEVAAPHHEHLPFYLRMVGTLWHACICIGLTPSALSGRLASDFVVDAFTGAGGNGVQLAAACASVLGIDLSAERLAAAAHNAALYGVAARLDLLAGDVLALLPCVRQVCIT